MDGLEEAAAVAHPLVRARALLALGRAERVGGAPAAAREPLREAMELASAAGRAGWSTRRWTSSPPPAPGRASAAVTARTC